MEEEPVSVPEDFESKPIEEQPVADVPAPAALLADEFSLDDITANPREKTREEIIAEAEAAAFAKA